MKLFFKRRGLIKEINTNTSYPLYPHHPPHILVSGLLWVEYRSVYIMIAQDQVNSGFMFWALLMGGEAMDVRMKNKKCEVVQSVTQCHVMAIAQVISTPVTLMWDFCAWAMMKEPAISTMWMEDKVICLPLSCLLFPWCHRSCRIGPSVFGIVSSKPLVRVSTCSV